MQDSELERFGTIEGWAQELNIAWSTLSTRLTESEGLPGRDVYQRLRMYFSESVVRQRCADLLCDVPQADDKGFFQIHEDGAQVRYGSINAWAINLGIGRNTLKRRIKELHGIDGKDRRGVILRGGFYAEEHIRSVCSDLVPVSNPVADEGFFELDNERYGTLTAWEKKLGLSRSTILKKLTGVEPMRSKTSGGYPANFYSEKDVRAACADLLSDVSQADEEGILTVEGQRYATLGAWSRLLGINDATVRGRAKHLEGIDGRDSRGVFMSKGFYSETDIRSACADCFADIPRAEPDGTFILDGTRYGSVKAWSKVLKVSPPTLHKDLEGVTGITGRDPQNRLLENGFYPEDIVRSRCRIADDTVPTASADGIFEQDGARYGTPTAWERIIGICSSTIRRRLRGVLGISGKVLEGRMIPNGFYSEIDVRRVCADLLTKHQDEQ